jgi:hypothetical protein
MNAKIIFPNASKTGSGGNLQTGSTVSLGSFPAGTAIGFIVYSNGWRNSVQTSGYYQVSTVDALNYYKYPQSVQVMNNSCQMLGIGFEDIPLCMRACDRDFNDVVIGVKTYPTEAMIPSTFSK